MSPRRTINRKNFVTSFATGAAGVAGVGTLRNVSALSQSALKAPEENTAIRPIDPIKIRELTAIPIAGKTLVRIMGDNGEVGYGEPSPMLDHKAMCAFINQNIAPLIQGETANDIERLCDRMFTKLYKVGPQGYVSLCVSGVDLALFDLLGRSFGLPVYQLLGGKQRARVKVYASSIDRSATASEAARLAEKFFAAGYDHTKLKIGVRWGRDATPANDPVQVVKAICSDRYIGRLALDANGAYTWPKALQLIRELEPYQIIFFEEPAPPYDMRGLAELTRRSPVPIATGESAQTKFQFRDLIVQNAANILQPDVQKSGGLLECKKISALAEAWNLPMRVHSTQVPIGALATLHFTVTSPMCEQHQEFVCGRGTPASKIGDFQGIQVRENITLRDSSFAPPETPGLGFEVDEKWLASRREDK